MLNILVVCTGNTCRSPMGEALINKIAEDNNYPVKAKSAGLAAFPGDCVSENAVIAMAELNVDISAHRARRLSLYDLSDCDYIICMSENHKNALSDYFDKDKIIVPDGGISDPYGGDVETYKKCRDELFQFFELFLKNIANTVIEPMSEETAVGVARLEKECFSVPWSLEAIKEELSNETAHFFVAKSFGEVIGYIGTNIILDECYITNVAVTNEHRRKGVGKMLIQKAITECKVLGCSFISLEVRKSNVAAISLYEKLGFKICGTRKNFYTEPTEDGLIMTDFFNED